MLSGLSFCPLRFPMQNNLSDGYAICTLNHVMWYTPTIDQHHCSTTCIHREREDCIWWWMRRECLGRIILKRHLESSHQRMTRIKSWIFLEANKGDVVRCL